MRPPDTWFVYALIAVLAATGAFTLIAINRALGIDGRWSISDALSEEVELPVMDSNGAIVIGSDGKVVTAPKLIASTSRLIALIGLFGILSLYIGFGVCTLFFFATGQGAPPGIAEARSFLLAGLVMFAPYVINKFANVFQWGQSAK